MPAVLDKHMLNTDHAPFYRDMAEIHSCTKKGAGGKNKRYFLSRVGTGSGEKYLFTVQLSMSKYGKKLMPFMMFKGALFEGNREHRRRTVANETHERLDD